MIDCEDRYKTYKNICKLEVFRDSCHIISTQLTLEKLLSLLEEYTKRKEVFKKCREFRIQFIKKCVTNRDYGHEKQLELLKIEEKNCDNFIKQIKGVLQSKQKTLDKTKKLLKTL